MPPFWLNPGYETGSDTDSDSEPSRPCAPVSSVDPPQAIREAIRETLSERHAAPPAEIDQRRSVRVEGQRAPHRVAAECTSIHRPVGSSTHLFLCPASRRPALSNHSAGTDRKRRADCRDDNARVAKRRKTSPAPPSGPPLEEYTKFGDVVIAKFRVEGGNRACGIPGCVSVLAATDVEGVRKHIRAHYPKGDKVVDGSAAPTGSKGKGKARAALFKCKVDGCKDQVPRDLACVVRHTETDHLGWKYRCLAKGCARESNRWDVLRKHMTESAGEEAHKTRMSHPPPS